LREQLEEGLRHKYLWSVAVDPGDVDNVIVSAASSPMHSHGDVNPESYLYRRAGVQAWRESSVAFPAQPAGILPFLSPIQPKQEHFSQLGNVTSFAPSMKARAGNASM
jgi:hypothetical protein